MRLHIGLPVCEPHTSCPPYRSETMKKLGRQSIYRILASACFVGATLSCSLLQGQQLVPRQAPVINPPAEEFVQPPTIKVALKPLIPAAPVKQVDMALKPLKPSPKKPAVPVAVPVKSNLAEAMPPVVAAKTPQEQTESTTPSASAAVQATQMPVSPAVEPTLVKGKNFPADAQQRISEFLKANPAGPVETPQVEEAATRVAMAAPATPQQSIEPTTIEVPNVTPQTSSFPPSPSVNPVMDVRNVSGGIGIPATGASIGGQASVLSPNQMAIEGEVIIASPGEGDFFDANDAYSQDQTTEVLVDYGSQAATFDCCGFITSSRYYAVFDTPYFQRNDGVFRASNITTLDDYGFQLGGRFTLGKKRDAMRGYEIGFMGFDPWIATSTQTNAAGTLIGAVYPLTTNNLPNDAYSAFRNGTYAQQWHKTDLYSFEANRTWWGSDVVKAFIGARYIHFQEDFRLSMANLSGQQGYHLIQGKNQMFGVHTGMEVLYDIGYRLSFSYAWKLGGYANAARNTVSHVNNGNLRGFGGIEKTDFAWSAEFGVWSRYKITPNIRLRAGYELFSLFNVYDTESLYSPRFGNRMPNLENQGDALFHGPSFGFEFYR